MAFFLDKRAEFRPVDASAVEDRIMHCAEVHGIHDSIRQLKVAFDTNVPNSDALLPDEDFALVWEDDGGKHRRYRIQNPAEVKAAADYLHKHRDHPAMTFEVRQQIADKILQKQAQLGVTLGLLNEFVEKQAGHGACSSHEAAEMILTRVHASRKGPGPLSELQTEMLKLAKMIAQHPAKLREPGVRVKVAAVVDQFDRTAGLVSGYGPDLPRVEDVLFGLTREKMAEAVREHVGTTTGNMYKLADLERMKLGEVRDYFGDDFADQMTNDGLYVDSEKAARFIQTLPRGDVEALEKFMSDFGIKPIVKEASAYSKQFSNNYLRQLAEARRQAMAAGR
jgi:hypothetical protein